MHPAVRLAVTALVLLVANRCGAQPAQAPLKVLFLGNSYTYVNDLPSLVTALADAAGGRKIQTDEYLVGGYTLEKHVRDKKSQDKLRGQPWDVVVLQEQSVQPFFNLNSMHAHARILDAAIKQQKAKTVFYLTWARQDIPGMQAGRAPDRDSAYARAVYRLCGGRSEANFPLWCDQHRRALTGGLDGAYFDIAKELQAGVAPVGQAWKRALAADPTLMLHQADKSHPAGTGSYLAACVFYATLLSKSPVGLPGELKKQNKLLVRVPPAQARSLQNIAWQVVEEAKTPQPAPAGLSPAKP